MKTYKRLARWAAWITAVAVVCVTTCLMVGLLGMRFVWDQPISLASYWPAMVGIVLASWSALSLVLAHRLSTGQRLRYVEQRTQG